MGSSVYSTPVPANGTLFIVNRNQLFALKEAGDRAARPSERQSSGVSRGREGCSRRWSLSRRGLRLWASGFGPWAFGITQGGVPPTSGVPASSPTISGTAVIVQNVRHKESCVAAFDLATGKPVWPHDRDGFVVGDAAAWQRSAVRTVLVTNGGKFIRGLRSHDSSLALSLSRHPHACEIPDAVFPEPASSYLRLSLPRPPIYAERPVRIAACSPPQALAGSTIAALLTPARLCSTPDPLHLPVRHRALSAQAPKPGAAPPDAWTQFRGSPSLTGTTSATLPAALKLLWTYDAGDGIESSAAIADGVVYVGARTGELHAVSLADGTVKWKYKASADGIGESSPAVAGGLVYVGDLSGVVHAVEAATGKAAWTFKTGGEVKSSPVVAGDRILIGSYDSSLYALGAKDGKLLWKTPTEGYVHATPAVVDGVAYITGCDEILRGIRITDGKEVLKLSSGAYTGASPADCRWPRLLRHVRQRGARRRSQGAEDALAIQASGPQLSVLLVRRPSGQHIVVGGRDKLVHAIDRQSGKAAWTFTTRRARRLVPDRLRRPGLRRLERRQAVRPRCGKRQERVRVRSGRPAVRLASCSRQGGSSSAPRTASCSVWGELTAES